MAIPQAMFLASRDAPYLLVSLPFPILLFGLGTLWFFWAVVTPEEEHTSRDIRMGAIFHTPPLLLILGFALSVLVTYVIPGRYTIKDPYYQTVITDPTLVLTPFLAFAMTAVLLHILMVARRGSRK
ncbi:MAG: hypothetical protein ACE5HJ_02425 [Thermoplasmata archaeon]